MSVQFTEYHQPAAHPPSKQWAFSFYGGPRIFIVFTPKGCRAATFSNPLEDNVQLPSTDSAVLATVPEQQRHRLPAASGAGQVLRRRRADTLSDFRHLHRSGWQLVEQIVLHSFEIIALAKFLNLFAAEVEVDDLSDDFGVILRCNRTR